LKSAKSGKGEHLKIEKTRFGPRSTRPPDGFARRNEAENAIKIAAFIEH
jgi:hypothetical protein